MRAVDDGWTTLIPESNLHDFFRYLLSRSTRDTALQLNHRTQPSTVQQLVFVHTVSPVADIPTRLLRQATYRKHPINSRFLDGRTDHSQLLREHFSGHHQHDL